MTTEVTTPSLIPTLPGSIYVDEAVFGAEQERIFEQRWFCAIRSADSDKAGAWRTVQVGRESVLISRTRRGQIRAFYNICRHRGVKLCMEEQGEAARNFQCPYHAWTYDFEGKLIAAPPDQDAG